ncbi:MAG: hypothetical protein ACO3GP_03180 [Candidatus Limnocylindrus sp.]
MSIKTLWRALRPDLKKHTIAGAGIAFSVAMALGLAVHLQWIAMSPMSCALVGLASGGAVGWLKEYAWDIRGHGTVDRDDYLYTLRGAAIGAIVAAAVLFVVGI